MVKTLTITDDVYEILKRLKEEINGSFSDVIRYLLKRELKARKFLELAKKIKIEVDKEKIKKAWKEWEKLLS